MIETWFLIPNTTGSALGGVGTAAAGLLWLVAWLNGGVGLLSWLDHDSFVLKVLTRIPPPPPTFYPMCVCGNDE